MNPILRGRGDMAAVIRLIGAVFFLATLPVLAHALTPGQVFDKVKDSVVVVKILDAQGKVKGQGSGVILPSGKVATNCHVVKEGASYQVGRGKQLVSATLYAEDGDKDICLLDAKGIEGNPAQLGKAVGLKVGDTVYAIGAPQGLELSLSDGIVAQLRGGPPPLIQTTAAVSPGSSGGGLFDGEGRLVGLTTFYLEGGQGLNFAMPVEWIGEVKPGRKLATGGQNERKWLMRAFALENSKDWQGLLDWCQKWTKNEPNYDFAWFFLGLSYQYLEQYNTAIGAYRQSLRINPESASTWYNLGTTYSELNRHIDAIDAYRQALRIDPEKAEAWNNLGIAYYYLERYDEAIEDILRALRINPKLYQAWYSLGNAYSFSKRYNDAIDAYRQAVRINPEHGDAWYNLGTTCARLNHNNDALEAFQQALRINPGNFSAWYNLGRTYGVLNRNNASIEAYRQALQINPEDAQTWYNLGIEYALTGNRTAALNAVRELRRLDPVKANELFNLIVPR